MSGVAAGVALGVDIGTSGVRVALVNEAGAPLATKAAPIDPARRREPAAWWAALTQAMVGFAPGKLRNVQAIAVDGTSGTVLAVDATGKALGPASLYNDAAAPEDVARIAGQVPETSAAHGATSPLAKLSTLRRRPGMVRMLHQADWIAGRLCGSFEVSDENNALKTGYDPLARRWPDWLAEVGAPISLLPRVVEPGTPIAPVAPDISARFGLPSKAIVAAGTTDGCAAFLATGASRVGEGVTSLGSTLTLKQISDRPLFARRYGVYSHRLGDRWLAGGASNSGGDVLAQYFDAETIAALSTRIDPRTGSGYDYYPLCAPGERFPIADPTLAPRLSPRPADDVAFLHGMLEGIARIEALGYRRLAELGGPALVSVRSVGGGARNAAWAALRAAVLGVNLRPARSEDAAVGAAGLALSASCGTA
jgi:D-ribulokinase